MSQSRPLRICERFCARIEDAIRLGEIDCLVSKDLWSSYVMGSSRTHESLAGSSALDGGACRCEVASSTSQLEPHIRAWEALGRRAMEDNFYFSPGVLCSALRHHGLGSRSRVVFVYAGDDSDRRLVGCAPFTLLAGKLGTSVLSTFVAPHRYLSHPLLDRELAGPALAAIWDWVEQPEHPWSLVRLRHMSTKSPTWSLIQRELGRRGRALWVKGRFSRALLRRHASFDAYLSTLPASRRKKLRQRWRRLQKFGDVRVEIHRSLQRASDLAQRFMELEARSWKGQAGTALLRSRSDAAFFAEVTRAAADDHRLLFVELTVDGRPVAMTANFVLGRTMFAFKIAYDPAFQECSPGTLAEIETVRAFHEHPALEVADAGTPGTSHLDAYWLDSQHMQEVYLSTGRVPYEMFIRTMAGLTRTKRALQTRHAEIRTRCRSTRDAENGGL
jgi:CelD/BcsL family acetyltransferase involved in cellulose biosynthesis